MYAKEKQNCAIKEGDWTEHSMTLTKALKESYEAFYCNFIYCLISIMYK